jgi:hypothetical protein
MQNITIKSGTSARISITPKINDEIASSAQLAGVTIYVFFVHQFTNKIYGQPYALSSGNLTINLTPSDTIAMLGGAEENQKFEIQFAIKTADGDIIAEEKDSSILINIVRWEAGEWLNQGSQE